MWTQHGDTKMTKCEQNGKYHRNYCFKVNETLRGCCSLNTTHDCAYRDNVMATFLTPDLLQR